MQNTQSSLHCIEGGFIVHSDGVEVIQGEGEWIKSLCLGICGLVRLPPTAR